MNKTTVTIKGNLVGDPKVGYTQSQTAYAHFTVAVNRPVKNDKGEWDYETEGFYDFTAWGTQAERVGQRLAKGQLVIATGTMRIKEYEKDGQKRWRPQFDVDEIGLNVFTKTWPDGTNAAPSISSTPSTSDELSDDLPF